MNFLAFEKSVPGVTEEAMRRRSRARAAIDRLTRVRGRQIHFNVRQLNPYTGFERLFVRQN